MQIIRSFIGGQRAVVKNAALTAENTTGAMALALPGDDGPRFMQAPSDGRESITSQGTPSNFRRNSRV